MKPNPSIGFILFEEKRWLQDKTYMEQDELNALIARNLERLMEDRNLNPSAWAKKAGLGHTAVRDITQGKVKNPTYSTLVRLAEAASVDVRLITVGPDLEAVDQQAAELVDLAQQLEPELRRQLIAYGEGLLAGRGRPLQGSPSDDQ